RRLAADLRQGRDARKDVGLEAWGKLLESRYGHELAAATLRKSFGAKELTPDWFRERLFTRNFEAFKFISTFLLQTHPANLLGSGYFLGVIEAGDHREEGRSAWYSPFAMEQLAKFDLATVEQSALRRLILRGTTRAFTASWVEEGRLKAQLLGLDFLKSLAYHPEWDADAWVAELKRNGPTWARSLEFSEELSERVLGWLRDVRRFTPGELGFEWLLRLAARSEPRYHDFAVDTMIKGFSPADFAPKGGVAETAPS
ncbi:BRCT domain-containing protein, partial [Singulisphaera rosea]